MIIPIRCFTCGKVLADKWEYYEKCAKEIEKKNADKDDQSMFANDKGQYDMLLEELQIKKICCRRHMLGHVDLINTI